MVLLWIAPTCSDLLSLSVPPLSHFPAIFRNGSVVQTRKFGVSTKSPESDFAQTLAESCSDGFDRSAVTIL